MKIKTILTLIFYFNCCFFCSLYSQEIPHVLVSVAPHKFFVEKIAGQTVKVDLMVPAGASAHTYEPTPKQMYSASHAALWFRIGEPFEERAVQALISHNRHLKVIDLRKGIDLIGAGCCHAHSMDLHFWLSARMAQIQAQTIADTLIATYPEQAGLYRTNVEKFIKELQELDLNIQGILAHMSSRNILVSHPAYAYFCRDYNIRQFSIEVEGKDPTPQQLTQILKIARDLKIKTIFIQPQYSGKGARLIAEDIKAKVVALDPYSEHYITSMLEIAHAFGEG
jgi:zinc transport system substrate-binding protein